MLNQFSNLSCYEEFEIQCTLTSISKISVLKTIGCNVDDYYFFISENGIFNWYDLNGNHVENPYVLKELKGEHIPLSISKCIIPDGVTSIGDESYWDCDSLKEIVIPSSVTSIGVRAFSNCFSLKEVFIPNSVTRIGNAAFRYCTSLISIIISNNITSIGECAFYNCISLKEITIPDSVTSINMYAFCGCKSLTSITIPNSVTHIGNYAFSCCESLKEIIFKGKTLEEVKQMENYPFKIEDESVFKFS